MANGHLTNTSEIVAQDSWFECTVAAEKIAHLIRAYKDSYTFRRIPYQLCYATYVASTILVRNANTTPSLASTQHLAACLEAFEGMKLAHPGTVRMEATIRSLITRLSVRVDLEGHIEGGQSPGTHPIPWRQFCCTFKILVPAELTIFSRSTRFDLTSWPLGQHCRCGSYHADFRIWTPQRAT